MTKCAYANNNKRYFLGVDGGGTKTEFLLFSEEGTIVKRSVLGACNPNSVGIDNCIEILQCGIDGMLAVCSTVSAIYIGSAGFLLGNNAEFVRERLLERYAECDMGIECESDILNVIACAGLQNENCIAVIGGTGFSVLIKDNNDLILNSGWGYLVSKLGSGFDIGRDGLNNALAYCEGLGDYTIITELIEKCECKKIQDILREVYLKGQTYVASFAEIVFEAYMQGDAIAKKIIEENAQYVATTINQICKKHTNITKVVLSGSLFTKTDIYREKVENELNSRLKTFVPEFPQIYGACVKCAQNSGADINKLKENFINQYRKCEE